MKKIVAIMAVLASCGKTKDITNSGMNGDSDHSWNNVLLLRKRFGKQRRRDLCRRVISGDI
jgi:hypothetical protein